MKEITATQLKEKLDNKEDVQVIDVRDPHEHEMVNIGGELIPMSTLMDNADKIARDKPVVLYCRSGARSAAIINALEKQLGLNNLYNLKGGIKAWAAEIDPSLPLY
jgi:rhodanese-related sulfurtransferase